MSGVVSVSRCCVRSSDVVVDVTDSYCSVPLLRLMSSIIYCGITSGVSGGVGGSAPSLRQSADDYLSGGKPCPGG